MVNKCKGGGELEKDISSSDLNGIYEDMADYLGIDIAEKVYQRYRGQQICFPVKLYSISYIIEQVTNAEKEEDIKEIASKYGYTVQWIKRLIKELKGERSKKK
jgi:hypothetical protein